jgi:hypothetical protein
MLTCHALTFAVAISRYPSTNGRQAAWIALRRVSAHMTVCVPIANPHEPGQLRSVR